MANDWRQTVDAVLKLQADETMKTAPGPSLQWYTRQYLSDSAVRLMGWAAQGVHMHLLMTAWEGFDFGDETPPPCSIPDDEPTIKALCHHPENWPQIWEEVRRGWKAREGRLWSIGLCNSYLAQMDRRRKATASGRAGGVAKAANAAQSLGQDLAPARKNVANASESVADAKSGPSSSSSSSSSTSPSVEESPSDSCASGKRDTAERGANGKPGKAAEFEAWWAHYPKKVAKKKARAAWMRLLDPPASERIIEFIRCAKLTDRWRTGHVCDGSTFVNQERWNDDLAAYAGASPKDRGVKASRQTAEEIEARDAVLWGTT